MVSFNGETATTEADRRGDWSSRLKPMKADSKIVGNETVVVTSSEVKKPVAVRFGWHPLARFNLINRERLPAVPFRTRRPKP